MSGVYRFEDLRVWQAAKRQPEFRRDQEISEHMNDASLSVMFNIAEGFLRRRDGETLQFLRYSFASNGELKAGYYAANSRKYLDSAETADLIALNESIARMLRRWMATLKTPEQATRSETTWSQGPRTVKEPQTDPGPGTDQGPRTDQELRTKDQGLQRGPPPRTALRKRHSS